MEASHQAAWKQLQNNPKDMVLLVKRVGAVELCQQDVANALRGSGSFTEEKPAGDYDIQKFSFLPRIFLK